MFRRYLSSGARGGKEFRSAEWFGKVNKDGFIHRSWMRNQGLPDHVFDGRPVIGIVQTWSELTPCNAHFRELAEYVKRGVWEGGGFPVEFPVLSTGESLMRPTAMLFRNLMAMDVEEMARSNPLDGLVLLTGCDKTTPGTIMGAASTDLPAIVVSGGPMLNGKWKGGDIGSGTDVWRFSEEVRGGTMPLSEFMRAEASMSRSRGHCNTMGTASTMNCVAEALGLSLPHTAAIPAADARRYTLAHLAGKRAVELVHEDVRIGDILTKEAFENAIAVNAAIGGSTNAIIHLLAIARRVGVELEIEDFDRVGAKLPLLVNLLPSGKFLMEDFFYAGGLPAVMNQLLPHLHQNTLTVSGKSVQENVQDIDVERPEVIAPLSSPLQEGAGIHVLRGNLAPNGAIIKPSAASPHLLKHRGPAFVFESKEHLDAVIDDPDLPVTKDSVLVLKGAGPVGYPGIPELGNLPIPGRLAKEGVRDMVRVSDARMSGTAYGTVVLHVSPESAVGGPLALVETGDEVLLDAGERRLELCVSDEELQRRRDNWKPPPPIAERGYQAMYINHVTQAHEGCDFDFLQGKSGTPIPRESH